MKISGFRDQYRWLSNFYPVDVEFEGVVYPSVEHAYQASKTTDLDRRLEIRDVLSPALAKKLGNTLYIEFGWEHIKLRIMEILLRQKFAKPSLRSLLIDTVGYELIEENWWNDTFWGVFRGKGENHLGKLIMKIRDELTKSS